MFDNITITTTLKLISCFKCNFTFAVPSEVKKEWMDEHTSFYCPNCSASQYYTGKTQEELLKEKLERTERQLQYANEDKNAYLKTGIALKGHLTRIKNRIGNGICPCCNRNFKNLREHMNNKHPNYKKE